MALWYRAVGAVSIDIDLPAGNSRYTLCTIVFKTIPIAYYLLAGAKFGNVQYFSQSQVWSRAELG